jgi:hypothetical protein
VSIEDMNRKLESLEGRIRKDEQESPAAASTTYEQEMKVRKRRKPAPPDETGG